MGLLAGVHLSMTPPVMYPLPLMTESASLFRLFTKKCPTASGHEESVRTSVFRQPSEYSTEMFRPASSCHVALMVKEGAVAGPAQAVACGLAGSAEEVWA